MDMNFPHPRRGVEAGAQKADYLALVASATAAQATSRTVRALLHGPRVGFEESDILESRINFFAKGGLKLSRHVRGAFLPTFQEKKMALPARFESAVNLADSIYGKVDQLQTVQPESQVTERGTEF
jgi:hypothetical protein